MRKRMKVAIIDYGMGNLANVQYAFDRVAIPTIITRDKLELDKADAIVLPGVGAIKDAMKNLEKLDLIPAIERNVKNGKLFLGICLGMQMLFERSFEDGEHKGLGLLKGDIVPFAPGKIVPHMGWNDLTIQKSHQIVQGLGDKEFVYYVHSYLLDEKYQDDLVATSDYGEKVAGIVAKHNVIGMQFHPEKSGRTGYKLLQNIKGIIEEDTI